MTLPNLWVSPGDQPTPEQVGVTKGRVFHTRISSLRTPYPALGGGSGHLCSCGQCHKTEVWNTEPTHGWHLSWSNTQICRNKFCCIKPLNISGLFLQHKVAYPHERISQELEVEVREKEEKGTEEERWRKRKEAMWGPNATASHVNCFHPCSKHSRSTGRTWANVSRNNSRGEKSVLMDATFPL